MGVMSSDRWFESDLSGLLTDLYEINMGACYFEQAMKGSGTFSLFVRKLPQNRSFLVSAGLEEALQYLENWKFNTESIDYLRSTKQFGESYLEHLSKLRFTGDVAAVPEGTVVFANEPILEVTAPIIEAQMVETYLLSALQLQTLIASKAARIMSAAGGRNVVDFGSRRAHGMAAALKIARTSYLVGFAGTSNVLAGKQFGIPVTGTLAHSFIQAFDNEIEAFRAFAKLFPENTVLLIDTYDTLVGARRAVEVGQEMAQEGRKLRGVRLDSGDVVRLSTEVRKNLERRWIARRQDLFQWVSQRVPYRGRARGRSTHRCLRCGKPSCRLGQLAGTGHGLQARGVRREAGAQALSSQAHTRRPQAGLSPHFTRERDGRRRPFHPQ